MSFLKDYRLFKKPLMRLALDYDNEISADEVETILQKILSNLNSSFEHQALKNSIIELSSQYNWTSDLEELDSFKTQLAILANKHDFVSIDQEIVLKIKQVAAESKQFLNDDEVDESAVKLYISHLRELAHLAGTNSVTEQEKVPFAAIADKLESSDLEIKTIAHIIIMAAERSQKIEEFVEQMRDSS